jgi:hypothetical protein
VISCRAAPTIQSAAKSGGGDFIEMPKQTHRPANSITSWNGRRFDDQAASTSHVDFVPRIIPFLSCLSCLSCQTAWC